MEASLWSSTNPSLYFLSVDFVVTSSTTSLSTEALERSPARSSQRVDVLDHRIDVLLLAPVLRLKREWSLALTCASACSWLCSFLPAVGYALFLPAVSFALFLPAVGFALFILFSGIIQTVHFTQTVSFSWSCVRSTASLRRCASARSSLRLRTLFHVLRVDWWSPAPHTPLLRALRV